MLTLLISTVFLVCKRQMDLMAANPPGGDSHIKGAGMLVVPLTD